MGETAKGREWRRDLGEARRFGVCSEGGRGNVRSNAIGFSRDGNCAA